MTGRAQPETPAARHGHHPPPSTGPMSPSRATTTAEPTTTDAATTEPATTAEVAATSRASHQRTVRTEGVVGAADNDGRCRRCGSAGECLRNDRSHDRSHDVDGTTTSTTAPTDHDHDRPRTRPTTTTTATDHDDDDRRRPPRRRRPLRRRPRRPPRHRPPRRPHRRRAPTTAAGSAAAYNTLPDGSPTPVVAIFDRDRITLVGAVPSGQAAQQLTELAVANSQFPDLPVDNRLTVNPNVPVGVGCACSNSTPSGSPRGRRRSLPTTPLSSTAWPQ